MPQGIIMFMCSFIHCYRVCVVNVSSVITSWGEAGVGGLAFSILSTYIMYVIICFLLLLVPLEGCDLSCGSSYAYPMYIFLFLWHVTFYFRLFKFDFVKFDFGWIYSEFIHNSEFEISQYRILWQKISKICDFMSSIFISQIIIRNRTRNISKSKFWYHKIPYIL